MKAKRHLIIVLLAMMAMLSGRCYATDYELWIAGVRVTSSNANHITGDGISGSVSYQPSTNILYLTNANINVTEPQVNGIENRISGLRIRLTGNNFIDAISNGVGVYANTTIDGSGTLTINSYFNSIFALDDLTITNCLVDVCSSRSQGIVGNINSSSLTIDGGSLIALGGGDYPYPIYGFRQFILQNGVTLPSNMNWNDHGQDGRLEYDNGTPVTGRVYIEAVSHQLWVAGQRLGGGYSGTGTYTFTGEGITGSVAYNFSTSTLTLSGATITASQPDYAITNQIPNLKIQVVGDNHITTNDLGIYSTTDMTFQGSGKLYINTDRQPISTCGNITINNCYISLRNNQSPSYYNSYGIAGVSSSEQILTINGGSLIATGGYPNGYPIGGFKHLVMAGGSNITFPLDSHYDEQSQRFEFDDGTPVANMVIIEPVNHQLWVAGEQLSGSSGTYTFSNSCITNGSVTYNFSANTLTLYGATITGSTDLIHTRIPNMKIELLGINELNNNQTGINAEVDLTIQGPGMVRITSNGFGICASENLTLNNCIVITSGGYAGGNNTRYSGVYGGGHGKTLTVNGGHLFAMAEESLGEPITGFGHLNLLGGTAIVSPENGYYDESDQRIEYANGIAATGEVHISVAAQPIWVGGVQVTPENADHITGEGITGNVSYDFNTNTLTLNNASIAPLSDDERGIRNEKPDLKIKLEGNNSISTGFGEGIFSEEDMTIYGSGKLIMNSFGYYTINTTGNLTMNGCTVEVTTGADNYWSSINGSTDKTLVISGGMLTANCGNISPITGFGHLSLLGVSITYPGCVHYDENDKQLENADYTPVQEKVVIEAVNHQLWVAGHQLGGNSGTFNFTGSGIDGGLGASYNYSNNTLTLFGSNITATSGNGIENHIPGLKIEILGTCNISALGDGIYSKVDMSIQDSDSWTGSLNVSSSTGNAIYTNGNLSIDISFLNARSSYNFGNGINGTSGNTLTVKNCSLTAEGGSGACPIKGFGHLYAAGVNITYPANAHYDVSDKRLEYSNGTEVKGKTVIEPANHQLWVAGHQLGGNSGTYTFTGSGISTGIQASYDYSTNTLTFFESAITATGDTYGIENHIPGLKIIIAGNCSISAESYGIFSDVDMTIQNSGSRDGYLTVTSTSDDGIYTKGNFTIEGCSVEARGISSHCIRGTYDKSLTINGGALIANGGSYGEPICGFGHLNMTDGVTISQPADAHYSELNLRLEYPSGDAVQGTAVIEFAHYDLWVDGTQATSGNANDILGDGKVSYDAVTNILTLNNVNINSGNLEGIRNEIPDLTINTVGECQLESAYETALVTTENLNISGTGKLYLIGRKNGIRTNGNLVLENGSDVVARSNGAGDFAAVYGDPDKTLTVNHSGLYARSEYTSVGTIYGFQHVMVIDSRIDQPRYPITWSSTNYRYEDEEGERVKGIIYIDYHAYNLFVKGTQVTSANADDVLGDGTVSYDPTSNTLTLNEANITSSTTHAIKNQIYGLKIALVGDNNRITANGYSGIYSSQDFFIQGRGKLVVTGSCGIYAYDCDLTVRGGCKLYPRSNGGNNYGGIQGAAQHTLSISECVVTASTISTTKSPISGFDSLVLDEMEITTPSGGTYHDGNVYDGNDIYYGSYNNQNRAVIISPAPYELWVKNIQVTAANASDILNDGGSLSYDAIDNVLTLNGATIIGEGAMCINNKIPGLVISLVGNNTVTSNLSGIYSLYDCTIEGRGTLDVTGKCGILTNGNLTLRGGCNLTVHGTGTGTGDTETGIYGSSNKTITIDGCYVSVSSASTVITAIDGFGTLALNEMTMTTPANGSFSGGVVRDNGGNPYYGQVVFSPIPYNLWVAGTQVNSANACDVFNDGMVRYDVDENVLTLNGANINVSGIKGIENKIPGLKVLLVGENTILSTWYGIYSENDITIKGRGNLTVTGNYGIFVYGNLEISGGCDLTATGTSSATGYCAINGSGVLSIKRSKVTASSNSTINSAIAGFTSMTLDYVAMTRPTNCTYSNRAIRYNSNNQIYTGQVVIEPDAYDIWIGGQQITSANALDVLGDGKVSYEWEEHELHLHEATLRYSEQGDPVIYTTYGTLNIYLYGDSYIIGNDGEGCPAIKVENYGNNYGVGNQLNFVGTNGGTLTTASDLLVKGNWTIYLSNTTVSIGDGGSIYAAGDAQENGFDISLYKSTLSAYSIYGMGYYGGNLIGGEIMQPEGARIDMQEGAVMLSNQLATNVVIGCGYGLFVGREEVTTLNANHITGDEISGNISFDPSTFTLTLENANIVSDNDGIHFTQPDASLEINLVGENTILSDGDGGIFSLSPVTIKGDGSLYTVGTDGIYCENDLSLEDSCTVETIGTGLDGSGIAYYGEYQYHRLLSIDENVTLKAHTNAESSQATIQGFGWFVLNNVEVLQPFGGSYNTTSRRFEDAEGNLYNGYVEIGNQAYDLWVANTQVTTHNASHITGEGISGNVSYDRHTNTLTLDNASISDCEYGIKNRIDNLTINLIGISTITSEYDGILNYNVNTNITGNGSLDISSGVGIYGYESDRDVTLTISGGCHLAINHTSLGIYCFNTTLWIDKASVAVNGTGSSGVYAGNGFQLIDVVVASPDGAYLGEQYVMDAEGEVAYDGILIEPIKYDLWVAGIQVTSANADHITGEDISGNVYFYDGTNTLTLENASIVGHNASETGCGIVTEIDGLTINLIGENIITAEEDGISLNADATISGAGTLDIEVTLGSGIWGYKNEDHHLSSLTVEGGCQVNISSNYGISLCRQNSDGLEGGVLTVDKSILTITLEGDDFYAIKCLSLVLVGTEVTTPEGYHFNEFHSMVDSHGEVPDHVVIQPAYDLWVAGTRVVATNAGDVLNDGTVSYDEESNVLALNGATIMDNNSASAGIANSIQGLVISLTGVNRITSNSYGIYSDADFAVEGDQNASLDVYGSVSFYLEACDLNIHGGCTVTAVGTDTNASAFYCHEGTGHTFTIAHSIVNANGEYTQSAISGFENLNLVEAGFVTPSTAVYSDGKIKNSGSTYHSDVVIGDKSYSLYVGGIPVTAFNASHISGENISGTVWFDAESNTLTLENAIISGMSSTNYTFSSGIENSIQGLKIKLIGSNSVVGVGGSGFGIYTKEMIIEGPGELSVSGKYGIFLSSDADLSIVGKCEMVINSTSMEAVAGGGWHSFIIEDSKVVLNCLETKRPIKGFHYLVLNGTEVTSPAGAEWDESDKQLKINGGYVYDYAVIEPCNVFTGTASQDWKNQSNWSKGELPLATSKVHIAAPCLMDDDVVVKEIVIEEAGSMTLVNDAVLTVNDIDNDDATRFVIVKGQLECNTEVPGAFHIDIASALTDEAGWYAIAVPMSSSSLTNLTGNTYDIYFYDEDADQQEWQNYKVSSFSFVPGQGYLYANSAATDLIMTGTFIPLTATVTLPLSYGARHEGIRGFNLVGNPYPCNLSMSKIKINGEPITEFYRFVEGANGTEIVTCTSGDILPGEAFFIKATEEAQELTIGGE